MSTKKYSVIIEKDEKNGMYVGQCCEFPAAISQGKTVKELMENMKEAIELAIFCQKEETEGLYKGLKVLHRNVIMA
ncbi:MAG: type II toxin-antitoxin system HicB family antitoxin [Bacteroidales bacterium]|nr:type II toxin-antitoxin system HicB family antitoxin [Bacteroidales bacterium]